MSAHACTGREREAAGGRVPRRRGRQRARQAAVAGSRRRRRASPRASGSGLPYSWPRHPPVVERLQQLHLAHDALAVRRKRCSRRGVSTAGSAQANHASHTPPAACPAALRPAETAAVRRCAAVPSKVGCFLQPGPRAAQHLRTCRLSPGMRSRLSCLMATCSPVRVSSPRYTCGAAAAGERVGAHCLKPEPHRRWARPGQESCGLTQAAAPARSSAAAGAPGAPAQTLPGPALLPACSIEGARATISISVTGRQAQAGTELGHTRRSQAAAAAAAGLGTRHPAAADDIELTGTCPRESSEGPGAWAGPGPKAARCRARPRGPPCRSTTADRCPPGCSDVPGLSRAAVAAAPVRAPQLGCGAQLTLDAAAE